MVEFIVKLGVFLFGNRWNSILASFVNLYLSNKFVRSYKVSKQLVTSKMLIYMADGKMRHGVVFLIDYEELFLFINYVKRWGLYLK